mmetsp:Transcript_13878/g.38380  ORF Transcript_13878/g.38380 Transcript_13878/m.38380 type:complete len:217 (-) Transcript_13878:442-1092(-)
MLMQPLRLHMYWVGVHPISSSFVFFIVSVFAISMALLHEKHPCFSITANACFVKAVCIQPEVFKVNTLRHSTPKIGATVFALPCIHNDQRKWRRRFLLFYYATPNVCFNKHRTVSKSLPWLQAQSSGVCPSWLQMCTASSRPRPCSTKTWTNGKWPIRLALWSGVSPSWSAALTLAPCSTKYLATSKWPWRLARWSGVCPSWLVALTRALLCPTKY